MAPHPTPRTAAGALLAIDAGNSAAKVVRVDDGVPGAIRRLPGSPPAAAALAAVLAEIAPSGVPIVLVSVVPAWTEAVGAAARLGARPLLVAGPATIPLPLRTAPGAATGPDRLLAAWAASLRAGTPVLVADLGTATTLEAVGPDGSYRGGAILPGIALGAAALATGTALLPEVAPDAPATAIGTETAGALRSGLVLGHAGALRELALRFAAELVPDGPVPPLVCTGGASARDAVAALLAQPGVPGLAPLDVRVVPDLLLDGLVRLAGVALPAAA